MGKTEQLDEKLETLVKERDRIPFKTALYTIGLALVVALAGLGGWAVYKLLAAFLSPIYWALLIGTVLFPAKQGVERTLRGWLRGLRTSNTPLLLGIVSLPFRFLEAASESLWGVLASKQIVVVVGGWVLLKVLTLKGAFYAILSLFARAYAGVDWLIEVVSSKWVAPLFILYALVFTAWAYLQPQDWDSMKTARILSVPIWFFGLVLASSYCGPLRVAVLVGLAGLIAAIATQLLLPTDEALQVPAEGDQDADSPVDNVQVFKDKSAPEAAVEAAASALGSEETSLGNLYLKGMVGASVLLWTVRHPALLSLFAVPLLYTFARKLLEASGALDAAKGSLGPLCQDLKDKVSRVTDLVIPVTMKRFGHCLFHGDQWLVEGLENSMDLVASVVVMLGMTVVLVFGSVWVALQVQAEFSHVVSIGTSVVRDSSGTEGLLGTALNYTGFQEEDMDAYVEQAFQHGRVWLAAQVRGLADPKDVKRADMLETQVTAVLDKLFEIYQSASPFAPEAPTTAAPAETELDVWGQVSGMFDVSKVQAELTRIATENVETLRSVGEGVWGVVSTNAQLLGGVAGAILGFAISFFMDFINVIIEVIVFLTMVYYLLASSSEQWKPLEWLGQASGGKGAAKEGAVSSAITKAVEEAISGVFLLSAKMALFYSLYTWFIHSLFQLNVVFVPSMLAGALAAVPLVAPPAVCVLGAVELGLFKGELLSAALFVAASFAPMAFADAAFYQEVKTSHPYVTGLAIVGGLYWLGPKGALIGPIILCSMLVLLKLLKAIRQQ